ncbi:MAG: hypothetical protein V3T18_01940, partial [Pseudomonadales bacterium]
SVDAVPVSALPPTFSPAVISTVIETVLDGGGGGGGAGAAGVPELPPPPHPQIMISNPMQLNDCHISTLRILRRI